MILFVRKISILITITVNYNLSIWLSISVTVIEISLITGRSNTFGRDGNGSSDSRLRPHYAVGPGNS